MLYPSWPNETKIQNLWRNCEAAKVTLSCEIIRNHCLNRKKTKHKEQSNPMADLTN